MKALGKVTNARMARVRDEGPIITGLKSYHRSLGSVQNCILVVPDSRMARRPGRTLARTSLLEPQGPHFRHFSSLSTSFRSFRSFRHSSVISVPDPLLTLFWREISVRAVIPPGDVEGGMSLSHPSAHQTVPFFFREGNGLAGWHGRAGPPGPGRA